MTSIDVDKLVLAIRKHFIRFPGKRLPYKVVRVYQLVKQVLLTEYGMTQDQIRKIVSDISRSGDGEGKSWPTKQ